MTSPRQEWRRSASMFMIIGIVISVAALTISFSVFEGYQKALKTALLSTNSHVYIFNYGKSGLNNEDLNLLDNFLSGQKEIISFAPTVIEEAMITASSGQDQRVISCQLRGIDWQKEDLPIVYSDYIESGNGKLSKPNEIVIGSGLATKLGVKINDSINLISPAQSRMTLMGLQSQQHKYFIKGIYHSGIYSADSRTVFMRYPEVWKFSQRPQEFTRIEIKVDTGSIDRTDYLSYVWENQLDLRYSLASWQDYNSTLFNLLEVEKWVLFFILSFLVVVASFNVVSTVSASIIERRYDIGILRAGGFSQKSIRNIFLSRIIGTGFAAVVTGELLGILISWIASVQNVFQLKGDVYFLDRIKVAYSIEGMGVIMLTSLVIITLAALIPLREIGKQNISKILRSS